MLSGATCPGEVGKHLLAVLKRQSLDSSMRSEMTDRRMGHFLRLRDTRPNFAIAWLAEKLACWPGPQPFHSPQRTGVFHYPPQEGLNFGAADSSP